MNATRLLHPLWHDTTPRVRKWPALTGEVKADVVIIGAGITGLSVAWHLIKAGQRVVVLEADEVGRGTTGSSTGNLYTTVGPRLHAVAKKHGDDTLRAVVAARAAAVDFIEARSKEGIACNFRRVPFHLFSAPDAAAAEEVRNEFAAARRAGLSATAAIPRDFPFSATVLTTVANQAQFNPLQYVTGLAEALTNMGCSIYENSRVLETDDGKVCTATTAAGRVTARHIVKATHIPRGFYAVHAEMMPSREYAVVARIRDGVPPPAIYWNASPAWHFSVRPWQGADGNNYMMALGVAHKPGEQKPGQVDTITRFLREHYDVAQITHTWAAQNYRPADLLPYIGTSPLEHHTWMATGFAADGLVWGTFAGKLISDGILEIDHPYAAIFNPKRFTPVASAKNFLKEQAAVVKHLAHDLTTYGRAKECTELAPGSGCVMTMEGDKVAVARDHAGALHVVSAHCTHLGCLVHWNPLELSWDCPCHGSRFNMDGRVIEGPAQRDLARPRG